MDAMDDARLNDEHAQDESDLALEVAYLRGLLYAKEQEHQSLVAARMLESAQHEAQLRAWAELSVRVAALCEAVTQLSAGIEPLRFPGKGSGGMLS